MRWTYEDTEQMMVLLAVGFNQREVAEKLNRSTKAIERRVHKARQVYVDGDRIEELIPRMF